MEQIFMGDQFTKGPYGAAGWESCGEDDSPVSLQKLVAMFYAAISGQNPLPITPGGSGQPYGATQASITNVAAGPSIVVFKNAAGATLKTRTYTYTNSGASSTDVLTGWADT